MIWLETVSKMEELDEAGWPKSNPINPKFEFCT